jgi:hypothetical protein
MATTLPRIVGVAGYAKSGKSTVADYLIAEHGFKRFKFADGLKDMLRVVGMSDEQIEGGLKETPSAILCGHTPREAMQSLGTEWGRKCVGEDLWVNLWANRVQQHLEAHQAHRVVVDDVRFPNELARVLQMGGRVLRIERAGIAPTNGHSSETAIDDAPGMIRLTNGHTIEALTRRAVLVLGG